MPISGRDPSNWELASARASGVVRVLPVGTPEPNAVIQIAKRMSDLGEAPRAAIYRSRDR